MSSSMSRRELITKSSQAAVASALAGLAVTTLGSEGAAAKSMPTRVLGKTGVRVSVLAFGCGSRLDMYRTVLDRG